MSADCGGVVNVWYGDVLVHSPQRRQARNDQSEGGLDDTKPCCEYRLMMCPRMGKNLHKSIDGNLAAGNIARLPGLDAVVNAHQATEEDAGTLSGRLSKHPV